MGLLFDCRFPLGHPTFHLVFKFLLGKTLCFFHFIHNRPCVLYALDCWFLTTEERYKSQMLSIGYVVDPSVDVEIAPLQ